jgi:hypothetical protein
MQDLVRFAQDRAVSWEILPHQELRGAELRQVGFDLRLHALAPRLDPAAAAAQIHSCLRELAERVLPEKLRFEILPYDGALRCRAAAGFAPEIDLVVEIRHREGTFDQLDAREREQIHAIGKALTRLGVPEGRSRGRAA